MACSNYPYCSYIKKEEKEVVDSGFVCPVCNKGHLVEREATKGRSKNNKFYGCSNYPKCKTIIPNRPIKTLSNETMLLDVNGIELEYNYILKAFTKDLANKEVTRDDELILCPKCQKGHLVKRVASRGKNKGNEFYACDSFPKCKNLLTIEEYNNLKK